MTLPCPPNPFACSFCGKSQREVKKLIAGPTVFICDERVRLCVDIIETHADEPNYEPPRFAEVRAKWPMHLARRRAAGRDRRHMAGPPRCLP